MSAVIVDDLSFDKLNYIRITEVSQMSPYDIGCFLKSH